MSKNQLTQQRLIETHKIEKGLSIKKTKYNFGLYSELLKRLKDKTNCYIIRFSSKDRIINIVYESLIDYRDYHKINSVPIDTSWLEEYIKYLSKIINLSSMKKVGGFISLKKRILLRK